MFCRLGRCRRVLLCALWRRRQGTAVKLRRLLEDIARSWPTTPTPAELVSSSHPASKSCFRVKTAPFSVSLPAAVESTSPFSKPVAPTTNTESNETAGPKFEVLPKIQSNIPTVVVTISISVSRRRSAATRRPVRKSVSLRLGALDESAVPALLCRRKTSKFGVHFEKKVCGNNLFR